MPYLGKVESSSLIRNDWDQGDSCENATPNSRLLGVALTFVSRAYFGKHLACGESFIDNFQRMQRSLGITGRICEA